MKVTTKPKTKAPKFSLICKDDTSPEIMIDDKKITPVTLQYLYSTNVSGAPPSVMVDLLGYLGERDDEAYFRGEKDLHDFRIDFLENTMQEAVIPPNAKSAK
jgi:hypothetical protein